MKEKITDKLTPIYWFEKGLIALCDSDNILACDADDDCNSCAHNKLANILANIKSQETTPP